MSSEEVKEIHGADSYTNVTAAQKMQKEIGSSKERGMSYFSGIGGTLAEDSAISDFLLISGVLLLSFIFVTSISNA